MGIIQDLINWKQRHQANIQLIEGMLNQFENDPELEKDVETVMRFKVESPFNCYTNNEDADEKIQLMKEEIKNKSQFVALMDSNKEVRTIIDNCKSTFAKKPPLYDRAVNDIKLMNNALPWLEEMTAISEERHSKINELQRKIDFFSTSTVTYTPDILFTESSEHEVRTIS